MGVRAWLVLACLGLVTPAWALDLDAAGVVDLTHPFGADTVYWPTAKPFALESVAAGPTPGGFWYAANNFCAAEHGGTHMDAPVHFAEGRFTADAVPLERLMGPAVVVDVSARAARERDTLVTVKDLTRFEAEHGRIGEGTIVLLHTGWSRWWPDRARYLGSTTPGDAGHLHFPGLDGKAAIWLTTERHARAVGIDTASIDRGASRDFPAHRALANANTPIFENLAGLEALPPRGAVFIGLPMKIAGGSGGPLRAVALLP